MRPVRVVEYLLEPPDEEKDKLNLVYIIIRA
jgi:hypothetical protein